ncbi:prophage tail fiber N-terminal domain-containing protein [Escherichia coli]|nr:prophage tail fiber N-terminal domain-containing protein [Escherichia coli]
MGKGSSKGHTPREAKDNLKSTQLLSVIDAISEGPVEGPVDGLKSVLLNSTPVLDTEGNTNISGVTVVFRAGEQEQTPPEGFESSGSETVLGTEVKYDTPITRTITSANIDRLRFTFGVQTLVETTSKGDRNPSEVRLLVQIQRNGGWVTEKDITIKGKTTSQYLASVVVGNLPPRPFNIRMRRMTPDSTTDQLQNKTLWSSYTEIIDVKQCYPNTALVGVQVDSEQFGSQQVSRNYHLRGRILQVPSNYNPQTRQYSGIWDGTFKPAYSNNMAWCLWDMLTHPRYGMGKRLGAADVDKWALYVIGQNCDQSVPDGFGGTEPRITCNAWLTTQRKAWDVLSDFCSAMRCMPVWNGQTLTFVQDRPSDKVWTYNCSNVVMPDDGAPFRYSFSALKDRHNAVEVNWIDPDNGWETATELVEDTQAIARYGRNVTKMDAFGCTSRGQAHRAGLWLIKTELLETQTVDFSVGAEGLRHVPGDVIEICDDDYAGISIGGRVLAVNSQARTLTLDREIMLPSSGTTLISLVDGNGNPVSVEVQSVTDGVKVKVSRVPDGVAGYSVWGLKLPTLRQRLFRCVSIRENDDGTYAITAVQHVPEKEAIVDNGAHFDGDQSGTVNGVTPPAVQHLTAEVTADSGEYQVLARWDTPKVVKGVSFMLRLTVAADDGSERLVSTARTAETTYRFTQLALGNYRLTVRAVNAWGQQGDPASVSFRIAAPAAPSQIELTPGYFQITATPHLAVYDPTVQFEFWFSEKRIADIRQVETTARYLGTALYWIAASINIKPGHDYYFYIRSVNTVGKSAFVEAVGQPSDDASGYLNFFKGEIGKTHLAQELWTQIDNGQLAPDLAEIRTSITGVSNEITQTVNKKLEDQSAAIQQIQKVQVDTNNNLNSMWAVKLQQMQDGRLYIAGIGAGIENTPDGMQSQVLLAADRIAMINPANGNTKPMFVGQGDQIFMNEVFLKYLTAPTITSGGNPPTFSLTPDGRLSAKNADISGNVNANSGTLNNVTINQNCRILGKLSANQIEGDIVKTVGKAFPDTGARNGAFFICGVNMAVQISGVLKDGAGKPIQNCTIQLKAKRNSTTVVVNTVASENPDEAGRYSMDVEYGQYSVILLVEGFPPSHAGAITVYEDSKPGTLNDFLGAATEDDVRPEALYRFEKMVEEVARNAEAASQSAAAAKKSETAAASSRNAAKTSETNAGNSAKAAASSKTAAQNAATAAERSETNARASEEASADSEEASRRNAESAAENAGVATTKAREAAADATKAGQKKDEALSAATRAEKAADRAEVAAEVTAEPYANIVPPLPDVWIPFNDSLDMIAGFSPGYKKIAIGDDVVQVASDKQVNFSRASTATYINKSGELKTAEINEPRFECDGLLIEGQRTNYMLNSESPASWGKSSNMDVPETGTDSFGFTYGKFVCNDSLVGQTSAINMASIAATKSVDVSGDNKYVTTSCRFKTERQVRLRIRFDKYDGSATTFLGDAYIDTQTLEINMTGGAAGRITARVRKDKTTGWIFAEATIQAIDGELKIGSQIQYSPEQGGATVSGDYIYLATPQVENGPCVSSFIISGGSATTRASDLVSIPTRNNLYKLPFTFLLEIHKNWDIAPNAAPRVWDIAAANTGQSAIAAINRGSGKLYMSLSNPSGSYVNSAATDVFAEKTTFGCIAKADGHFHVVTNGKAVNEVYCEYNGVTADKNIRFGGQTNTGERHLFGHIRNFRIWHKELNDRQLKEVV